jgi:hypothetical protein
MTSQTLTSAAVAAPVRSTSVRSAPRLLAAAAGVAYSASWVAGLLVSSSSTDVHSSGAQILAGLAGHEGAVTAQYVLTEGLPAVLLAIVAIALAGSARRAGARSLARIGWATGLGAAGISLAQCAIGLYLTGRVAPAGNASAAATLTSTINHLDGAKMLVLAGFALAGAALARGAGRVLPRWLSGTGWALAVALVGSGAGYLCTIGALAQAAYVSLPLLLIWVTGAGVALRRTAR